MNRRNSYFFKHYDIKNGKRGVLLRELMPNLEYNRRENMFPDIYIFAKDGKEIYAHRIILASKFPSLAHMLNGPYTEENSRLYWRQFGFDEIEDMMSFSCTGVLEINPANVKRIFLLSICLHAQEQIDWCIQFMLSRVNVENMQSYLRLDAITRIEKLHTGLVAKVEKDFMIYKECEYFHEIPFDVIRALLISNTLESFTEEARFSTGLKWLNSEERWAQHFEDILSFIEWSFVSKSFVASHISDESTLIPEKKYRQVLMEYLSKTREYAYIVGRDPVNQKINRILVINPLTQKTMSFGTMKYRDCAAILGVNEYICAIGGGTYNANGFSQSTNSVEVYNTKTNVSHQLTAMKMKRSYPATATLNEHIVVCGGWWMRSCEVYNINDNRWTDLPDMNEKRCRFDMVWLKDGRMFAFGGTSDGQTSLSSVETLEWPTKKNRIDESGAWRIIAPMAHERYGHSAAEIDGKVYVVGGSNLVVSTEIFTPPKLGTLNLGQWTTITEMQKPFETSALLKCAGKILAFSTKTEVQTLELEKISKTKEKWTWKPLQPILGVQRIWGVTTGVLPLTPRL